MKKSLQSTDGDIAERNEHARKIFRYISEVARRLDEANGASKTISDLFKTSVEINRQKLRDNCEKLMFADPVLYGHKAQEILWRKGYYEVVTAAKQFHPNDCLNSLLAHIEAGIGHYQQIIYKMQMEGNINMKGFVDYPILDIEIKSDCSADVIDNDLCARSKKAIQNCLIYIGDLCRYKAELETDWDPTYSARYYLQAACINRDIGMPYNQLGTLFIGKNYNLDSVCYYLHCLTCPVPFEGVEDNLVGLLDKNNKMLEDLALSYSSDQPSVSDRMKLFIARFLSLLDFWYFQKDPQSLGELSNITLFAFKDCLELKLNTLNAEEITDDLPLNKILQENELNPHYISPNIVLNVTSICLLCLSKMKESDEKSLFPIKAFTLAFFSQLLEKLLRDLEDIGFVVPILNRSNGYVKRKIELNSHKKGTTKDPHHKITDDDNSINENHEVSNGTNTNDDITGKVHKKPSKVRLRRRKHRSSNSVVDSAEDSCSDLSELEINDSGDDISLEGESSSDEYCSEVEGVKAPIKVESEEITEKNIEKSLNSTDVVEATDVSSDKLNVNTAIIDENKLNHFLSDNILPSMLLLQAFLLSESDLIKSSGKSGHILFKTLVDILNILNVNFLGRHTAAVEYQAHRILDEFQLEIEPIQQQYNKIPLPEDIKLRNIDILKHHQDNLKWDILEYFKPSTVQENAIRIMRLSDFGNFITSLIPGVCYNRSQHFFFVKYKFLPKKLNQKINAKKSYEKKDLKRQNQKIQTKVGVHPLTIHNRIHHSAAHNKASSDTSQMRILGKLWLMNQVRELETQVKSGKKSHNFPPYVVVDTDALCLHIKIIKQLVGARKFIVLIPTVVLQAIDELKKESSGARDAIRWLEAQLRSGSRFLRAQRSTEVAPLTWIKYPKRMNKDMQNFVNIIEFCNHFIIKDSSATKNNGPWSGNGDSPSTGDVQDSLEVKAKSDDKTKEQNGDSQPANIIVLLTGSKQYLTSVDQNKDFSFTGLATTAGVTMEFIQDFSLKWRHIFFKNVKKR